MSDTLPQPVCIYCETARPASVETCPTCGRPWIDKMVVAPTAAAKPSGPATPELQPYPSIEHENLPLAPVEEPVRRIGLVIGAVAVVAALIGVAAYLASRGTDDNQAATTTTTQPGSTVTTSVSTTGGVETSTTTEAPDDTTTTTDATTTTIADEGPSIEPIGEPVAVSDLGLGAFALGPFEFGQGAAETLGRLAATFGEPDSVDPADASWGLCEGDSGRVVAWGPLSVITTGTDESEILAGYRMIAADGTDEHPAAALTTLSGIALGDTITRLREVYANSTVDYPATVDGVDSYRLLRSTDDQLLLWGPVGSGEAIAGIYAPRSCDGGP